VKQIGKIEIIFIQRGTDMDFNTRNKELIRLNKLISKHSKVRNELLDGCTHDKTILKHDYTPGGYLDTGYEEWWDQCTLCGKRFNERRQSDGSYG
jgi:hypothetical protein